MVLNVENIKYMICHCRINFSFPSLCRQVCGCMEMCVYIPGQLAVSGDAVSEVTRYYVTQVAAHHSIVTVTRHAAVAALCHTNVIML